jgi:hypothetical protein
MRCLICVSLRDVCGTVCHGNATSRKQLLSEIDPNQTM